MACPGSHVLPQVHDGGSEDAERGSAIGRFSRDVLAGEDDQIALEQVPRDDWRATCRNLDWDSVCGDLEEIRAEVAYAVHPETLTVCEAGINLGRRYPSNADLATRLQVPVGSAIFVGTNDLEGVTRSRRNVVCDIKTGLEVTACSVNPQMRFHALARYLLTGASEIEARLLYVRSDGRVFVDGHIFGAFELELFADALCDLVKRIERAKAERAAGTLTVMEGRHCTYCPAYPVCQAKVALARAMITPDHLLLRADSEESLSPLEGGKAWMMASELIKLGERVKKRLNGMARVVPLHTRPGKIVRQIESHTTEFAEGQAMALLRELGATQTQLDALYVETPTYPVREVNEIQKKRRSG